MTAGMIAAGEPTDFGLTLYTLPVGTTWVAENVQLRGRESFLAEQLFVMTLSTTGSSIELLAVAPSPTSTQ